MSIRDERGAQEHPGYDTAIREAAVRAASSPQNYAVYWDGAAFYVRNCNAAPTPGMVVIAIAQRWDAKTVQLRFSGARSEWVKI
jgi:hypothetical protein